MCNTQSINKFLSRNFLKRINKFFLKQIIVLLSIIFHYFCFENSFSRIFRFQSRTGFCISVSFVIAIVATSHSLRSFIQRIPSANGINVSKVYLCRLSTEVSAFLSTPFVRAARVSVANELKISGLAAIAGVNIFPATARESTRQTTDGEL